MIFYQVNRIIGKSQIINQYLRRFHNTTVSPAKVLYPLRSRSLLKIKGQEASVFLQGLITNDMKHFDDGARSMYAMFLNNKGRVLYDTLIHRWTEEESFMIECDKRVLDQLQKHLKIYKLKRKVLIEDVNNELMLWALISSTLPEISDIKSTITVYNDPRLAELGSRVISPLNLQVSDIVKALGGDAIVEDDETGYRYLRYKLGVSEGAEDLPPGSSFPLEANCDYLHGVSFHKGCYIGQELTARVHHTGVVRKRIMPIKFNQQISENIDLNTVISASNNPKSNLGKLKAVMNDHGLGLIRVKEALDAKVICIDKYSAEPLKPSWWPMEAPKEIQKNE